MPALSLGGAIGLLSAITVAVAVCSEFLTGAIEAVSESSGINQVRAGAGVGWGWGSVWAAGGGWGGGGVCMRGVGSWWDGWQPLNPTPLPLQGFLGLIVLPIAGNACEHITAVFVAVKASCAASCCALPLLHF